jgi:hypothetical protein
MHHAGIGYGIGDHRMFIIVFLTSDITGSSPPKVVRPLALRLITNLPGVAKKYNSILKGKVLEHRLIERMGRLSRSHYLNREFKHRVGGIDNKLTQYMRHAEKMCQQFKSGCIPFSPILSGSFPMDLVHPGLSFFTEISRREDSE